MVASDFGSVRACVFVGACVCECVCVCARTHPGVRIRSVTGWENLARGGYYLVHLYKRRCLLI